MPDFRTILPDTPGWQAGIALAVGIERHGLHGDGDQGITLWCREAAILRDNALLGLQPLGKQSSKARAWSTPGDRYLLARRANQIAKRIP